MKQSEKKPSNFFAFLRSLCSAKTNRDSNNSKDNKKCKIKVNKVPRLTFQLDRVLVKVSRKNVAQQQFLENQVLTYHLEKYLANRLKDTEIAILSGQFSNFLIEKIPFCLQLKSLKEETYECQNNYVLFNHIGRMKFRFNSIDTMAFQLFFGENQLPQTEDTNSQEVQQIKSQVNANLDKIQQILRSNQKKVKNFVFICHKDLKLEDIHGLFLVFKENYIFELEKVKKIQKTVCNIIYASTDNKFLRIDDSSLCEFVMCQFDKMRAFGELKKNTQSTLETFNFLNISKNQKDSIEKQEIQIRKNNLERINFSKETARRHQFQMLISKLFQKSFHLKVSQVLATILQFPDKRGDKVKWFLDLMHQRHPQSRSLVDSYRSNQLQENDQVNKTSSEFTPLFVTRFKQSNDFSKVTALFDTQNSHNEDLFELQGYEGNQEIELPQEKTNLQH